MQRPELTFQCEFSVRERVTPDTIINGKGYTIEVLLEHKRPLSASDPEKPISGMLPRGRPKRKDPTKKVIPVGFRRTEPPHDLEHNVYVQMTDDCNETEALFGLHGHMISSLISFRPFQDGKYLATFVPAANRIILTTVKRSKHIAEIQLPGQFNSSRYLTKDDIHPTGTEFRFLHQYGNGCGNLCNLEFHRIRIPSGKHHNIRVTGDFEECFLNQSTPLGRYRLLAAFDEDITYSSSSVKHPLFGTMPILRWSECVSRPYFKQFQSINLRDGSVEDVSIPLDEVKHAALKRLLPAENGDIYAVLALDEQIGFYILPSGRKRFKEIGRHATGEKECDFMNSWALRRSESFWMNGGNIYATWGGQENHHGADGGIMIYNPTKNQLSWLHYDVARKTRTVRLDESRLLDFTEGNLPLPMQQMLPQGE